MTDEDMEQCIEERRCLLAAEHRHVERRGTISLLPLCLRGLKSHDHETWHVGLVSDLELHGTSGILIFGRVAPQGHAA